MRYHLRLIIAALGSATLLSACSPTAQQVSLGVAAINAGNTAGAIVAGIVNPAIAIPAGAVAGALNGANCFTAVSLGGHC